MPPLSYSASEVTKVAGGKLLQDHSGWAVSHLLTDSRNPGAGHHSIFFAISGERNNGHHYIDQVYQQGVRAFVISEEMELDRWPEASFILVEDVVRALQDVAAWHRRKFEFPVLGITGSNGKTTVKEWLFQLLAPDYNVVKSPKSYNSQIGVPLSVWQIRPEHNLAVIEAGISLPGEMKKLESVIQPSLGLITNVLDAHIQNFEDRNALVQEKISLFENTSTLIYCADHEEIARAIEGMGWEKTKSLWTWSMDQNASVRLSISDVLSRGRVTTISGAFDGTSISIEVPFTDRASIENAIHCWLTLLQLGLAPSTIAGRMKDLMQVGMRLELIKGIRQCTLINDTYNSDLYSLDVALDYLHQQQQHKRKTLILSDIFQSGEDPESLYKQVATLIRGKKVDRLIGIGPDIGGYKELFDLETAFYNSTDDLLSNWSELEFNDEAILIKGAREFRFERITKRLSRQSHETLLEVNLSALVDNLNYFKSRIDRKTKIMAMVKAMSYGSGSFEIASLLAHHKVDYLAVAYVDEGKLIREAGVELPIMVMSPAVDQFKELLEYKLEPEVYGVHLLQAWVNRIEDGQTMNLHLKLDTGMHRLGFEAAHIEFLAQFLLDHPQFRVKSVFTHLAASEDVNEDEFTHQQVRAFEQMSGQLSTLLGTSFDRHVLNSNGTLRFPEYSYDMVRLGIGLYGITSITEERSNLRPVSRFATTVSQVKTIPEGDTVGYGRAYRSNGDLELATVPVGYGDGLARNLGNGRWSMRINGKAAPIIGNVCMDMCMLDVTGMGVKQGDEVVVFGPQNDIYQLAEAKGTIPYEVLTSVSHRVKRNYFYE